MYYILLNSLSSCSPSSKHSYCLHTTSKCRTNISSADLTREYLELVIINYLDNHLVPAAAASPGVKVKIVGHCRCCWWCHAKNAQHNKSPNPRKQIYFNSLLDIATARPVPVPCCCSCCCLLSVFFFPSWL